MNFLKAYKDSMVNQLSMLYGEDNREELDKLVQKTITGNFKDRTVKLNNKYKNTFQEMTLTKFFESVLTNTNYAICGNGAIYDNRKKSLIYLMLDTNKKQRKVKKGKMFDSIELANKLEKGTPQFNETMMLVDIFNMDQNNEKLYMNSYYGIMGEKNSLFGFHANAEAVTVTGRIVITNAIVGFENFFGNLQFHNFTQLSNYIYNVLSHLPERVKLSKLSQQALGDVDVTYDEVLERLSNATKIITDDEMDLLEDTLKHLTPYQLFFLYFKNNYYAVLDYIDCIKERHNSLVSNKELILIDKVIERIDKGKDLTETEIYIDELWIAIKEIVSEHTPQFNRMSRALSGIRKHTLTIDTDSSFIYLQPFINRFSFNIDSKEDLISTINIATYITTRLVADVFSNLTERLNVLPERSKLVAMKNEFLISRIILTSRKKWYTLANIAQEGKIFNEVKIEFKGLTLKKSSVHKSIKDFFINLISEEFYKPKIDPISILSKLKEFETNIINSINNASLEYSTTSRVNPASGYAFPYRIEAFRGAIIWNYLHSENPIAYGEKAMIYKVKGDKIEDLDQLAIDHPEKYEIIKKNIFENPEFENYGFNVIAFPYSQKEIPEWLIPYIDSEIIATNSLVHIYPLLESIGITIHSVRGGRYYTNMIQKKKIII